MVICVFAVLCLFVSCQPRYLFYPVIPGNNNTQTPSNPTNTGSTGNTSTTTSNEPTFTEVNQTVYVYNTESVNVRSGPGTSYSSLGRVARNTAVTRTGVGSNGWSRVSYNGETAYISSSYLTTTKPEEEAKSSNAMLSGLTVDVEGLSPEFNKDTDNYTLQVGSDVEAIQITATPEDENATVQVQGNENLQEGENTVTITVTAEDGTTKVYTITVNKGNVEQVASLGLSTLTIAGIDMEEVFSPTTYEYTIEINQDVSELEITAEPNEEGATVEIIGNGDLQEGENLITILVSDPDGENVATYQVTINKSLVDEEALAREQAEKDRQRNIIIGVLVAVVVIAIIIIVVVKRRRKNEFAGEYTVPYQGLNKDISDLDDDVRDEYDEDDLPKSLKNNNLNDVNEDDEKYKNNIEDLYKNQNDGKTIEEVEAESETKKSRKIRRKGKRYLD